MVVIRFDNVGLKYGSGDPILSDVSLHIAPNSFWFLSGPSGAGKTSLMRLIFRSLKPTSGDVTVFGQNTKDLTKNDLSALRRRIGLVFQDFRLLDHLTLYENVALPLRVIGREEASYRAEVKELLDFVGLGDRMNALPAVLSGGEKQRTAIARALIFRPELLLADEPTGNVDSPMARRLLRLFTELHRSGTSIILATHDYTLMDSYDAKRLVIDAGHVVVSE
jgi:cell division transport system ATP-binding protein